MSNKPSPQGAAEVVLARWGEAIRARRRALDLTQTQLGYRAGEIDQSTISKIEHGEYKQMTPALVIRLAVALQQAPHVVFPWPDGILELARYEAEQAPAA